MAAFLSPVAAALPAPPPPPEPAMPFPALTVPIEGTRPVRMLLLSRLAGTIRGIANRSLLLALGPTLFGELFSAAPALLHSCASPQIHLE